MQVDEVYRGMMVAAAHMHLMIRDAYDSARFCPTENPAQHQNIRQWVIHPFYPFPMHWSGSLTKIRAIQIDG